MHFAKFEYLFLLVLVPLLVVFFIVQWHSKKQRLAEFAKLPMLAKLVPSETSERQKIKMILIISGLFFLLIGFAGPQFGKKLTTMKRKGIDVLIAVDTSYSMLAEDIKPNRMTRAREELKRLAINLEGNRIGIIAFAGTSFVQCPLTLDMGAIRLFFDFLDVGIVPQQGTEIGHAIRLASKTFKEKAKKYKALVLLTDGEDHNSKPLEAAINAKKQGIRIYTIGFGTSEGEVIPIKEKQSLVDYKKDKSGKIVTSRLDEALLKKIAYTTNGKYYSAADGYLEAESIANNIKDMEKKELSEQMANQYEERFYIIRIFTSAC
ncbi:VWA domain-containing protein [bacterium]